MQREKKIAAVKLFHNMKTEEVKIKNACLESCNRYLRSINGEKKNIQIINPIFVQR